MEQLNNKQIDEFISHLKKQADIKEYCLAADKYDALIGYYEKLFFNCFEFDKIWINKILIKRRENNADHENI